MNDTAVAVRQQPDAAALEKVQNTQLNVYPSAILDRENLTFFANMIEAADLIPKEKANGQLLPLQIRKSRVMAKICAGCAHGFDPISSQQNLDIIDGKIGLNARGLEVKLARTGKYSTRVEYLTDKGCKLAVLEKKDSGRWVVIGSVEFTEEHAKAAGLLNKPGDMYKKYGPDMYFARCITRVCKRYAPETLDTVTVGYNLAKRELQQAEETPTAPAQIAESETQANSIEVGSEYVDEEYIEPVAEAELVEDDSTPEFTGEASSEATSKPIDSVESNLVDLIVHAKEKLNEITGGKARAIAEILDGRRLDNLSLNQVKDFLVELEKIEATQG